MNVEEKLFEHNNRTIDAITDLCDQVQEPKCEMCGGKVAGRGLMLDGWKCLCERCYAITRRDLYPQEEEHASYPPVGFDV